MELPLILHLSLSVLFFKIPLGEANNKIVRLVASGTSTFRHETALSFGGFSKFTGKRYNVPPFKKIGSVESESACIMDCLAERNCTSINVAESTSGEKTCELIDSYSFDFNHSRRLRNASGNNHFTMTTECLSEPCKNLLWGVQCSPNYSQNTYRCICSSPRHYDRYCSDNCTDMCFMPANGTCSPENSLLLFPDYSTSQDTVIKDVFGGKSVTDFTVVVWAQFAERPTTFRSLFSFQASTTGDEFDFGSGNEVGLINFQKMGHVGKYDVTTLNDLKWHHIAISRESTRMKFYIDGEEKTSSSGSAFTDRAFKKPIRFTLGQEQDSYDYGSYDINNSFKGKMGAFYMWDKTFTDQQILDLYLRACPFDIKGAPEPVLNWKDIVSSRSQAVKRYCGKIRKDLDVNKETLCMKTIS